MIGITRDARLLDPRRDPAVLVAGRPADLLHALPYGTVAAGWRLEATGRWSKQTIPTPGDGATGRTGVTPAPGAVAA